MSTLGDSFVAEQWLNNDPDYIKSIKYKTTVALHDRANRNGAHVSEGEQEEEKTPIPTDKMQNFPGIVSLLGRSIELLKTPKVYIETVENLISALRCLSVLKSFCEVRKEDQDEFLKVFNIMCGQLILIFIKFKELEN
eukprot:CAMPEP_0170509608 /NCGR_PEP_ID=MMETSP0208-20121228/65307_1 /TAXON_ID=197538 /ORGANISM="Strombidium inclinatum, Strain S3" /LENGTH=137 /DNA_ID=CAMNT_0010792981 /DNA_START=885 /DNA_END=1298 /DNA_ORIENTATION=+